MHSCQVGILSHLARLVCEEEDEAALAACFGPSALPEVAWRRTRHVTVADRLQTMLSKDSELAQDVRFAIVPAAHAGCVSTHPSTAVLLASVLHNARKSHSRAALELLSIVGSAYTRTAVLSDHLHNLRFGESAVGTSLLR